MYKHDKWLMAVLGRASATETLDTDADLWPKLAARISEFFEFFDISDCYNNGCFFEVLRLFVCKAAVFEHVNGLMYHSSGVDLAMLYVALILEDNNATSLATA